MTFFEKAKILDELKELKEITIENILLLRSLISDEPLHEYFFHDLNNPNWFLPLNEFREFSTPPSPLTEGGGTQVPPWDVMEYLIKIAPDFPDEIVHIASDIPINNSRVIWGFVEVGLKLSPVYTAKLVPLIDKWKDAEYFQLTNFGVDIGKWIKHLVDGTQVPAALELLKILTKSKPKIISHPEIGDLPAENRAETIPVIDDYGFSQLLEEYLPPLVDADPFSVVEVLDVSLSGALDIEFEENKYDLSYLWRPAIEDDSQNWDFGEFKERITVALRNTIQGCAVRDPKELKNILEDFLNRPFSIFKRLAIHTIRLNLKAFFELGQEIVRTETLYRDREIHHEFALLLNEIFPNLSPEDKTRVIFLLQSEPWFDETADPERQEKQKKDSILSGLALIKEHLTGDDKQRYDDLNKEVGPVDHPLFLSYHESGIGESSPTSTEKLKELSPEEVIEYVKEFKPKPGLGQPTPRGLAGTLFEDFKSRPEGYIKQAKKFLDGVRPTYTVAFLDSILDLGNSGKQIEWSLILDVFHELVRKEDIPQDNVETYEESFNSVRRRISDMLTDWLKHQKPTSIPFEYKNIVWNILEILLHDPEPDKEHEEKFGGSNMNPPLLCINTVRGKAMHALINYALWHAHHTKKDLVEGIGVGRMEPRIRSLLDEKLNKNNDSSQAIHSVFGQFLPNLMYLNKGWVQGNLENIFPKDLKFWKAAWGSYVSFTGVYKDVYEALGIQYRRAIEMLPDDKIFLSRMGRSPEEALTEHLMIAILNDIEPVGGSDLIDRFFQRANDRQRAHAIHFIGSLAKREKLFQIQPHTWQKALQLWEQRLADAKKMDGEKEYQEEFSAFIGWAEYYQDPLEKLYEYILATIQYCVPKWRITELFLYLAKYVEQSPLKAITILEELMKSGDRQVFMFGREDIRKILLGVMTHGNEDARRKGVDAINKFGEWGFYEFRDLLDIKSRGSEKTQS